MPTARDAHFTPNNVRGVREMKKIPRAAVGGILLFLVGVFGFAAWGLHRANNPGVPSFDSQIAKEKALPNEAVANLMRYETELMNGSAASLEDLIAMTHDPDLRVRSEAFRSLAMGWRIESAQQRIWREIERARSDKDPSMRRLYPNLLAMAAAPQVERRLQELTRSTDPDVAAGAQEALTWIERRGGPGAGE